MALIPGRRLRRKADLAVVFGSWGKAVHLVGVVRRW